MEELLSTVASHFSLRKVDGFSLAMVGGARKQLLQLVSEDDVCLIEVLTFSCTISTTLKERYKQWSLTIELHNIMIVIIYA